jgi:hypothetical protein
LWYTVVVENGLQPNPKAKKILPNPEVYGEKSTNSDRELQSKSIKALQHLSVDTENKIK